MNLSAVMALDNTVVYKWLIPYIWTTQKVKQICHIWECIELFWNAEENTLSIKIIVHFECYHLWYNTTADMKLQ